jgi:Mor family transcriptional regulator
MDHGIKIEDLPPIYQIIAKIIGMENAILLGKEIGGESLYLPKLNHRSSTFLKARDRQILEEHNGRNTLDLARKYEITTRRLYEIIKKNRSAKKG